MLVSLLIQHIKSEFGRLVWKEDLGVLVEAEIMIRILTIKIYLFSKIWKYLKYVFYLHYIKNR